MSQYYVVVDGEGVSVNDADFTGENKVVYSTTDAFAVFITAKNKGKALRRAFEMFSIATFHDMAEIMNQLDRDLQEILGLREENRVLQQTVVEMAVKLHGGES